MRKYRLFSQKFFIKTFYKYQTGKSLNLKDPKDFNEKIQWLKIYYKPSILPKLVDKYEVRSFIEKRIGKQYLNQVYEIYNSVDEIDFDKLPKRFIFKATHGYNMNLIVKDKSHLNKQEARDKMSEWLKTNHYYVAGREWAYKEIKPRILAEKFLEEKGKDHINDYKFYCFNGEVKFIKVDIDRGIDHATCYYDTQWNKTPFDRNDNLPTRDAGIKPENLEEMLEVSARLAAGFPLVRVDLYNIDGKIIFGEMTFYPADGKLEFDPPHYNRIIGDYIKLPKIPKGQKVITSFQ